MLEFTELQKDLQDKTAKRKLTGAKKPVRAILGVERPKEVPTGRSTPVRIAIWALNARKKHLLGVEHQKEASSGRLMPDLQCPGRSEKRPVTKEFLAFNARKKQQLGVERRGEAAFGH